MEDKLGIFLVKLSNCRLGEGDSRELTKYLHIVSDFERISDHAVNILFCAREKHEKNIRLSEAAWQELGMRTGAIREILSTSDRAFEENDCASPRVWSRLSGSSTGLRGASRTATSSA